MGAVEVRDGKVVPGSYQASPNHFLLTENGFFRLSPFLDQRLQQELTARASKSPKSTDAGAWSETPCAIGGNGPAQLASQLYQLPAAASGRSSAL